MRYFTSKLSKRRIAMSNIKDFGRTSFVMHTTGLIERLEKRTMNERISFAAILRTDNVIIFGRDHARCYKRSPYDTYAKRAVQGFLTDKHRFVNRKAAASIAFLAGQIDKIEPNQTLVSEELWWPEGEGKYDYDEKLGYIKRKDND